MSNPSTRWFIYQIDSSAISFEVVETAWTSRGRELRVRPVFLVNGEERVLPLRWVVDHMLDSEAKKIAHATYVSKDGEHPCEFVSCHNTVGYDDEPYCFTHSSDSGSYVVGYSWAARQAARRRKFDQEESAR
jgi:hypothetical protein